MSDRKPLSKKLRFKIFKRDEFTCQYCGQKPPAVVLEVDHVISVAEGGSDDEHNLISSCFDCNRGKGRESLSIVPVDIAEKSRLILERQEQVKAYEELLADERLKQDSDIDDVIAIYEEFFKGWTLLQPARNSIRQFLKKLPKSEVEDAMEIACSRVHRDKAFRYFCGVCWRKIKGPE